MQSKILNSSAIDKILIKLEVIDSKLKSIRTIRETSNSLLTTKEAAKALKVTTRTLQTYRDQGDIPFIQFGREVRFRAEDIQQFLSDHYVKSQYQKGGTV